MARSKITPSPVGSTFQPMMSRLSGHRCSPAPSIAAMPGAPARTTQAAAPSPNSAVATMLALVNWSRRNAAVQISIATTSTVAPGRARARRPAIARPVTPPAQPSPNTGTRSTSARKPICRATRASRLGVAMPVDDTVTMVSTASARQSARASAAVAASTNRACAPSR